MDRPGRIEKDIDSLEADLLNIEREINGFKNVLLTVKPKFVLSVEAPWGTGKSTFLRILEDELKDHSVIKINAWESDYSNDPIAAILNSLTKSDLYKENQDLVNDIFEVGLKFAKKLLPIIVSIVTQGMISRKGLENFDFHELTKEVTSTMVEEFKEQEGDLTKLREKLEALVEKSKTDKIYFLVDELDRCRPIYAVEFLESIKHLFSVDGIVFVLGVESKVLKDQMKQIYGAEFQSDEYLKKFIDIRYELKPRINLNFIQSRFKEFGIDESLQDKKYFAPGSSEGKVDVSQYQNLLYALALLYNFSPRDLNQIITKFLITLSREDWDNTSTLITFYLLILQQNSSETLKFFMQHNLAEVYSIEEKGNVYKRLNLLINQKLRKQLGDTNYSRLLNDTLPRIINVKAKHIGARQDQLEKIFKYRKNVSGSVLSEVEIQERTLYEKVFNTFSKTDNSLLGKSYEQVCLLD